MGRELAHCLPDVVAGGEGAFTDFLVKKSKSN
jgi:hypothetical protein